MPSDSPRTISKVDIYDAFIVGFATGVGVLGFGIAFWSALFRAIHGGCR